MSEVKIELGNAITKRFIEDKRAGGNKATKSKSTTSPLHQKLSEALGINIKTHALAQNILLIGDPEKLEKAEVLIQALDQRIGILATDFGIKGKDDITDRSRRYVNADVDDLIEKMKSMDVQEFKKIVLEIRRSPDVTPQTMIVANDAGKKDVTVAGEFGKAVDRVAPKAARIHLKEPEFSPRNQNQAVAYTAIMDPNINVVVLGGSAGGGKTYVGLRAGIELLNQRRVERIMIIKPRVTTNKKDMGALPGKMGEKVGPYVDAAISTTLEKLTGEPAAKHKLKTSIFEALPPDFERGETYDGAFVFIDEAQNLTRQEAKMLITRIGEIHGDTPVKIIVTGDISGQQNDLRNEMPGLAHLIAVLGPASMRTPGGQLDKRIAYIKYTDEDSAARSDLLVDINKAFNNLDPEYQALNDIFDTAGQNPVLMKAIKEGMAFADKYLTQGAERTFSRYVNDAQVKFPAIFGKQIDVTPRLVRITEEPVPRRA